MTMGSVLPAIGNMMWTERCALPLPRAAYIVGSVGGTMLLAGGTYWDGDHKVWTDRTDIFDPDRNEWTTGPSLPAPRAEAACITFGDTVLVFGGGASGHATDEVLEFRGGRWRTLPVALPEPRINMSALVADRRVYVIGGRRSGHDVPTNTVWSCDPRDMAAGFTSHEPIPGGPRMLSSLAGHGGRAYAFGGYDPATDGNFDDVLAFDPVEDRWSTVGALHTGCRAGWAEAFEDGILLIGGYTDAFSRDIRAFNPVDNSLRFVGQLPHALADAKFARVGSRLLTAGGECGPKIRAPWTLQLDIPG